MTDRYAFVEAAGQRLALPAETVVEVLLAPHLERPTGSPPALAGVMNRAGRAEPVIDLSALLGGGRAQEGLYSHVVRLNGGAAVLVDRVTEVAAEAEGREPADPERSVNGWMAATLIVDGAPVPLIDPDRLLLAEEEARAGALAEAVQARLDALDAGQA